MICVDEVEIQQSLADTEMAQNLSRFGARRSIAGVSVYNSV